MNNGGILGADQRIQDAEALDHRGIFVGEEIVSDPAVLGEALERVLAIVADAIDLVSGGIEFFDLLLQLDQLRDAVGSPHGRAIKDDGRLFPRPVFVEVDYFAVLIGQLELGKALADVRSGRKLIVRRITPPGVADRHAYRETEFIGPRIGISDLMRRLDFLGGRVLRGDKAAAWDQAHHHGRDRP